MCILILHHRVIPGYPVVVVANRDEARDRPSDPPFVWTQGFLAPRDRLAGGTWIGINRQGLFAGITNRSREPRDPALPTRGELVIEALSAPNARAAVQRTERVLFAAPRNPFNLLIADPREAFLITGGHDAAVRALKVGTHVLTNEHELGELDLGDLTPPADIAEVLERLRVLSKDHGERGYALCKHGERYGTVSSTIIVARAAAGEGAHPESFAYADGLPCQTPHLDLTTEVQALKG